MAKVTVTGRLADLTDTPIPSDWRPVLIWTIPRLTATLSGFVPTYEKEVTPSSDGSFSVALLPSDDYSPPQRYILAVKYLDPNSGEWRVEELPRRLYVSAGGGNLGDMAGVPISPDTVWVSPVPDYPADWNGYWLEVNDPDGPDGGPGNLYEVRSV